MQSAPRRPVDRREVIAKHKLFIKERIRNFYAETSLETAMVQTVLVWVNDDSTQAQQ
jgi:hypothetical protein